MERSNALKEALNFLQAENLRMAWPVLPVDRKLRLLNQFGYSADSVDAMAHGLDELIREHGAELVSYVYCNPNLTVTEALEEL